MHTRSSPVNQRKYIRYEITHSVEDNLAADVLAVMFEHLKICRRSQVVTYAGCRIEDIGSELEVGCHSETGRQPSCFYVCLDQFLESRIRQVTKRGWHPARGQIGVDRISRVINSLISMPKGDGLESGPTSLNQCCQP